MVVDVLRDITIADDPSGIRFVLDKGREKVRYKQVDPAGLGGQVNPLSGVSTVEDAVSRFTTAHARALKAEHFARAGNIPLAFKEWGKIFGQYFPTYG